MKKQGLLTIGFNSEDNSFPLVCEDKRAASIHYDERDARVVAITADLLRRDIEAVTGVEPELIIGTAEVGTPSVIIGTVGQSALVDQLISEGKLDVTPISDQWEAFLITSVDSSLVIAGADRRGTAFGVFTLSRAIGVSPWYWWSEVHPIRRKSLYVKAANYTEGSPSVKFRGLFINDEVMGPNSLHDWAKKTFEPEEGRIGPKTYARVFELLLRLKANYCWPAMHPPSLWFYKNPANPQLAEDYAIVVGTSHCEQMHRNNMTEWNSETMGPWNYKVNRQRILQYWRERLETSRQYENTYTVGIRGTEDTELEGTESMSEMVGLTQQALDDQRRLLTETMETDAEKIPQVLCLYKEVLVVYQNGLDVPEDITLLWVDDNHGYIRQLSTPEEQQRSGGSGVYYHLSLLGTPEGYLWLSTNSPALIASEMTKAYEHGADRVWMFNVGDIKPAEKELHFAMDLAWDINSWAPENAGDYMRHWARETFGEKAAHAIGDVMNRYYILAASGKPEHVYRLEYTAEEMNRRIYEYEKLGDDAEAAAYLIPDHLHDAYLHLVLYPVQGARWLNVRMLAGRRSLLKAAFSDGESAFRDAEISHMAADHLEELDRLYNSAAGGKWENFMTWQPRFHRVQPQIASEEQIGKGGNTSSDHFFQLRDAVRKNGTVLDEGTLYGSDKNDIAIFNWNSEDEGISNLWVRCTKPTNSESSYSGEMAVPELSGKFNNSSWRFEIPHHGNVWHTRMTPPTWYEIGEMIVKKGENTLTLDLNDPLIIISDIRLSMAPPLAAEHRLVISATEYRALGEGSHSRVAPLPGLGTGAGLAAVPFTAPSLGSSQISNAPRVEYSFPLPPGSWRLHVRTLPNHSICEGRGVRYAVSVNGGEPVVYDVRADEFSSEWQFNVIHGFTSRHYDLDTREAGDCDVTIFLLDPGLVLRELIVDPL